ncbi:hypothetical protein DFQ27_006469 [Actinomortierella ambigua]|uniref:Uncharacterized protein n=1 Tax=Actinomortierella ambigua TaxID=1343610 RepID=A0A9P6U1F9_9FUNG|nr:hypothetical protein DFQ27_006469 [Actinomortierella ambigua]
MRLNVPPVHPKRALPTSDSDEPEEIDPSMQDDRPPNHSRFFGCLSTEPLIEWVLVEGNLDATENPVSSRHPFKTKTAVWEHCAEFVTKKLQAMMENDRSLGDKARKELDKILQTSKKEKAKKRYENAAAEWARGKVRHLANIVRRTCLYVYKRTGQRTLEGKDLDEQAEKLCPHFAELRDMFDKTATFRISFNRESSLNDDPLEDKGLGTGTAIDSDDDVSRVGSDGEDEAKSLAGSSAKKQKVAGKNLPTVDSGLGDMRSMLPAQQVSTTWASVWQQELKLLREELKTEREERRKEREKLEANLDRLREALTVRFDKERDLIVWYEERIKASDDNHGADRANLISAYESRFRAFELKAEADRKMRDDMLVRALAK